MSFAGWPTTAKKVAEAVQKLSQSDFEMVQAWIITNEYHRRQAAPFVAEVEAEIVKGLEERGVIEPRPVVVTNSDELIGKRFDELPVWVDPKGAPEKKYRSGDYVTHKDKVWLSAGPYLNGDEPGKTEAWGDVTDQWKAANDPKQDEETASDGEETASDGEVEEWKPTQAYEEGQLITYEGDVYKVIKAHKAPETWPTRPGTYYQKQ